MFIGSLVWGVVADKIGRRTACIAISACITVVSVGTSTARNVTEIKVWLLLMGISTSGFVIPFDLLAEFSPNKGRAARLLTLNYFWALGSLCVPLFAYLTIGADYSSWRRLVLMCAIPCFVSLIMGWKFAKESPRWLMENGRPDEAKQVLKEVEVRVPFRSCPPAPYRLPS